MAQFVRVVPMQFIAALGNPESSSGTGASEWGIWRVDPGPRGVHLEDYELIKAMDGFTPSGWILDQNDWWLEENGLIMEKPDFPIPEGRYIVTGGREKQSILRFKKKHSYSLRYERKLVSNVACRGAIKKALILQENKLK